MPARALALAFSICVRLHAADRWTALSQVESGDNDHALGSQGEVSRYQIKPAVWRKFASPKADWRKPEDSLPVAKEAMRERCSEFVQRYHRLPSDLEFYVLWNAPAQIHRPSKVVRRRAERFHNLLTLPPQLREASYTRLPAAQPAS